MTESTEIPNISRALEKLGKPGRAVWFVNNGLDDYLRRGPKRSRAATIQLKVRMKEPLRAKIEQEAGAKGISMNAEIVQRLQRSFDYGDLDARLRRLESLIPETRS